MSYRGGGGYDDGGMRQNSQQGQSSRPQLGAGLSQRPQLGPAIEMQMQQQQLQNNYGQEAGLPNQSNAGDYNISPQFAGQSASPGNPSMALQGSRVKSSPYNNLPQSYVAATEDPRVAVLEKRLALTEERVKQLEAMLQAMPGALSQAMAQLVTQFLGKPSGSSKQ